MAGRWLTREGLIMGIFAKDEKRSTAAPVSRLRLGRTVIEIGWFLRKSARGQGIATEAVSLCCKLAFEHIQANRVWGTIDVLNAGSWKLAERAGFTREAHLRGECRDHHGVIRDTFVYAMLAREWMAN